MNAGLHIVKLFFADSMLTRKIQKLKSQNFGNPEKVKTTPQPKKHALIQLQYTNTSYRAADEEW